MRPIEGIRRDTYKNIKETRTYTVNHVPPNRAQEAHQTSAKYEVSEFDRLGFTPEYRNAFSAPYVRESDIKFGLEYVETVHIKANDTRMIIGTIKHLYIPNDIITTEGYLDISNSSIGSLGLHSYYKLDHLASYPYAKTK
mgnify:CR=1 FL=1